MDLDTNPNLPSTKQCALEPHRIPHLPPSFYYIPSFISPEEESSLLSKLPPNRWTSLSHRRLQSHPSTLTRTSYLPAAPLPSWLAHPIVPRLGALGAFESTLHGAPNHVLVNEYRPGEGIMMHADGDAYESVVATVSLGGSVCLRLASGSSPGREKEEGEEEGGSAGSTDAEGDADADGQGGKTWILPTRILQEPRSLLITRGVAYETLLHGIDEVEVDEGLGEETVANWGLLSDGCRERVVQAGGRCERGTRISLTYRDVKKVSKALGGVLGRR